MDTTHDHIRAGGLLRNGNGVTINNNKNSIGVKWNEHDGVDETHEIVKKRPKIVKIYYFSPLIIVISRELINFAQ